MKKLMIIAAIFTAATQGLFAQTKPDKDGLRFNLNDEGTHYFQATFLNQTWLRFIENNPGTTIQGVDKATALDLGLRRTRIQMYGQLTDKVFLYFQFGQNNFNTQFNATGNRKLAAFFHDAVCEYKVFKNNALKVGGGLTIANGLSRFSQPSIGSIMTMDVPVFAQATVDQTDEFSRKLSVYARGQVSHLDYRVVVSNPFPITSNGQATPAISKNANFSPMSTNKQFQGYFAWQFFDHENHTTPYMTGTYLGKKKIFNVAAGFIYQKNAMWAQNTAGDTTKQDMKLFSVESFLDMPLNAEKEDAISAYVGYFNTNYGTNYLRYNGIMNPANGTTLTSQNSITGQGPTYGNALPMFGTGQVIYSQVGYLLPKNISLAGGRLMPYASATLAKYDRLDGKMANTYNAGVNWLINGHKAKLTLDYQNRPTFAVNASDKVESGSRKSAVTLQYQIMF